MNKIMYCPTCKIYMLDETCTHCDEKSIQKAPQRYSPQHRMSKYRRETKKEILEKEGLL